MLDRIGHKSLDNLFDSIPESLRFRGLLDLPPALTEMELQRHAAELARKNASGDRTICFLGGGSYDHFVPAVVDVIGSRSEYYTAYTPYQAEASQGTLQVGFEYQTLMCQLTGMEVSNASMYEAATSATEAALMAMSSTGRKGSVVVSESVHPEYRKTLATYFQNIDCPVVTVKTRDGSTDLAALEKSLSSTVACLIVQSPNFFGGVEPVGKIVELAKKQDIVVVQAFDPISLGVLKRPGDYGVDVAIAEGHTMGTPMSFGGPFLGIFTCKEKFVRKIPGRVIGQTVDRRGNRCFVLTLQTREQHIRREKATSNICTNQALFALRASVYLSLLGPQGIKEVAELCWHKAHYAAEQLVKIPFVKLKYTTAYFKEFVVELPCPAVKVIEPLLAAGFHAGLPLGTWYPDMENCLLVAVTEKRNKNEIDGLVAALAKAI